MIKQTEAVLLACHPHGENAAVVTVFGKDTGKLSGLVRGTSKKSSLLQPGTLVRAEHRRRLNSQLGSMTLEALFSPAALCFEDVPRLATLAYLAEILRLALPEEEPHPGLYTRTEDFIRRIAEASLWERLAFYELGLLTGLGYGLSLRRETAVPCEEGTPLTYVSPRTGRAVSAAVGAPYKDRLLPLPALFGGPQKSAEKEDFLDVFRLTGHFLHQAVHGKPLKTRETLLELAREQAFRESDGHT